MQGTEKASKTVALTKTWIWIVKIVLVLAAGVLNLIIATILWLGIGVLPLFPISVVFNIAIGVLLAYKD